MNRLTTSSYGPAMPRRSSSAVPLLITVAVAGTLVAAMAIGLATCSGSGGSSGQGQSGGLALSEGRTSPLHSYQGFYYPLSYGYPWSLRALWHPAWASGWDAWHRAPSVHWTSTLNETRRSAMSTGYHSPRFSFWPIYWGHSSYFGGSGFVGRGSGFTSGASSSSGAVSRGGFGSSGHAAGGGSSGS